MFVKLLSEEELRYELELRRSQLPNFALLSNQSSVTASSYSAFELVPGTCSESTSLME